MNHAEKLISPALSVDDAKSKISTGLDVTATKLALVPKDSMREVLAMNLRVL